MKKDKESDYFAMGFRLYDPEIGRFLAIDPLLDVQPSQTPYHYCFNNPTSFTDPTGLYPEKEKGDKVLVVVSKVVRMEDSESLLEQMLAAPRANANINFEMESMSQAWFEALNLVQDDAHYRAACYGGGGGGGGGSSSGRIGVTVGENGKISINGTSLQSAWDNLPDDIRDKIKEELDKYQDEIERLKKEKKAYEMSIRVYYSEIDGKKFWAYEIFTSEKRDYSEIYSDKAFIWGEFDEFTTKGDRIGSSNAAGLYAHIHFHPANLSIDERGNLSLKNNYNDLNWKVDKGPSDQDWNFSTSSGFQYHFQLSRGTFNGDPNYKIWGYQGQKVNDKITGNNYPLQVPWRRR